MYRLSLRQLRRWFQQRSTTLQQVCATTIQAKLHTVSARHQHRNSSTSVYLTSSHMPHSCTARCCCPTASLSVHVSNAASKPHTCRRPACSSLQSSCLASQACTRHWMKLKQSTAVRPTLTRVVAHAPPAEGQLLATHMQHWQLQHAQMRP